MKIKSLFIASSIVILLAAASCATKKEKPKNAGALNNLPAWVIDPAVADGVAGVGIASPSAGGIKFQIPKAEMDAKANIASTIQSEISRVTKQALRESKINDVNDVEDFFAQATKEVVKDLPLSGVKRINIFQAQDGTLYVQMVLKNEDYSKFLANSEKTFSERLKRAKMARQNIDEAQKSSQVIFDELEKERGL